MAKLIGHALFLAGPQAKYSPALLRHDEIRALILGSGMTVKYSLLFSPKGAFFFFRQICLDVSLFSLHLQISRRLPDASHFSQFPIHLILKRTAVTHS